MSITAQLLAAHRTTLPAVLPQGSVLLNFDSLPNGTTQFSNSGSMTGVTIANIGGVNVQNGRLDGLAAVSNRNTGPFLELSIPGTIDISASMPMSFECDYIPGIVSMASPITLVNSLDPNHYEDFYPFQFYQGNLYCGHTKSGVNIFAFARPVVPGVLVRLKNIFDGANWNIYVDNVLQHSSPNNFSGVVSHFDKIQIGARAFQGIGCKGTLNNIRISVGSV